MAITSLINPSTNSSAQDALWHIATSSNSGQTDFKFVFDVFKSGQQLVRVKLFPDVDTGKGYFDASSVVKNEFTYDWFTPESGNGLVLATPSTDEVVLSYDIRVGEDFSGITTLNLASGTTQVFNFVPSLFKRRQLNISSFDSNFLSNRSRTAKLNIDEKLMIPYYQSDPDALVEFKSYGINNNLISSESFSVLELSNYNQLDIGPVAVNTYCSYDFIDSSVYYYTVRFHNIPNDIYSDIFKVYIDCNPNYTPINLHFINQFGMYETARFSKASRLNMSTERKSFQRKEYDFKTSTVEYYDANNVYKESKINYGSKSNWTYRLTMDFPSDQDYEWLAELVQSPQIYAEIDSNYYPVTLNATNYEYSTYQNNGLRIFEVEIELNQTRNGFRR